MQKLILMTTFLFAVNSIVSAKGNRHFSHTVVTAASRQDLWQVWTDVDNWHKWDSGLRKATIYGEFKTGTKGELIPDKGPSARFVITEVYSDSSYVFKTKIPLGWLVIKRFMQDKSGQLYFTHDVKFKGLLSPLWAVLLGKRYRKMLPVVMEEIRKIAEAKTTKS